MTDYLGKTGLVLLIFMLMVQCDSPESKPAQKLQTVTASDFGESDQVTLELADGFEMNLWAPGPLLSNAVSLSFDPQGNAYVSETARRKSSDIDIRAHKDWMIEDIALETIEDTRTFHMRKLAPSLSNQNTWQEDFNQDGIHDFQDLTVQSERIRIIKDTDQDGRADVSHIFAEEFDGLITGVAAGVLVYDRDVYLTAAPDLWKIQDSNRDDIADNKQSISHGYGIHIAYAGHDMSGLTIGPDGKLYWSIGDMGVNTDDQNGKQWAYPHEGAVMRCNPDGSDFEVFAHGLRNPQELAFTQYGDLISVDNDGDHPGEHERIVHILEGSDAGWRIYWQYGKYTDPHESYKVWIDEKLHIPYYEGQAAYIIPPISLAPDGPCGLDYNSGKGFGPKWQDHFFASYFTGSSSTSKVEAFKLEPAGASYTLAASHKIVGGIVPTGVAFSPDGALYINDWKDGYDKKPTGRIWKLNTTDPGHLQIQKETFKLLNSDWSKKPLAQLQEYLSYDDRRIRLESQFELVKRNAANIFESVIENNASTLSTIHAIWGLGQLGRAGKFDCDKLVLPLKEDNPEIRVQAAKVLGENKVKEALDDLIIALEDESPRVQRHAAEALGKIGDIKAFDPLIQLIENHGTDPSMRHTTSFALSRLQKSVEQLQHFDKHKSPVVRMGSMLALRHLKSPYIIKYLDDSDTLVAMEVARAIHDDESIVDALPHLANALNQSKCSNPVFIRRAINANLRIGDQLCAQRLKRFALNATNALEMRREAIYSLGYWKSPPLLDRVEGRYRKLMGHKLENAQVVVREILGKLSPENELDILVACIEATGSLNIPDLNTSIFRLFNKVSSPSRLRIACLKTLALNGGDDLLIAFEQAIESKDEALKAASFTLLDSDQLPEDIKLPLITKLLDSDQLEEKQKALLGLSNLNAGKELLTSWMGKAIDGSIDQGVLHEVLTTAKKYDDPQIKSLVDQYYSKLDSSANLDIYRESIFGGNMENGRKLFYKNPSVPCVQCHVIQGEGGEAGPDLSLIGANLSREDLLLSMVDPNARIAPGYGSTMITLKSNESVMGMIQNENSQSITIKEPTGDLRQIIKSDIKAQENLPSGMIPVGGVLSKGEIRDLIEYLVSLQY